MPYKGKQDLLMEQSGTTIKDCNMGGTYEHMSKNELLDAVYRQEDTINNLRTTIDLFEKKFSGAQLLANIGFWEADIPNDIATWSDQVYKIYDLELGSKVTYDVLVNRIHPEDREYHHKLTEDWIRNRGGELYEYRIVTSKGDIIYIRGYGKVVCDDKGEPIKFVGALQDITKETIMHKKLEDSLKEKQQIYLATICGAKDITNNLLNQLILVDLEIDNHPDFDKDISKLFKVMRIEAKDQLNRLSSVKQIDAKKIKESLYPK